MPWKIVAISCDLTEHDTYTANTRMQASTRLLGCGISRAQGARLVDTADHAGNAMHRTDEWVVCIKKVGRTDARDITIHEFLAMEEGGGGFGYYGHSIRKASCWLHVDEPHSAPAQLDAALIQMANRLGISKEYLFEWADSRGARHTSDFASGGSVERARHILLRSLIEYLRDDDRNRVQ